MLKVDNKETPYDVIVCGAGHAGCEAALAAARMGAAVLMLTGNLDTVAQMSCNPAIGGQAKGHIVREIDALGGEMAINADRSAIQFRLLNASKGPAVQAPRAQCDKKVYQLRMKHILEKTPGLTLFQAMVDSLIFEKGAVVGVKSNLGHAFYGKTVVVTTGTFLRGLMHVGSNTSEGGRMGDFSAKGLSKSFLEAGIELQRLKTGTPPRILGSSINFSLCEEQPGDEEPTFFAFHDTRSPDNEVFHVEHFTGTTFGWAPGSKKLSCWITETTEKTAAIITGNLDKSPLYCGQIKSSGPRYCPSIEDKFVRFADKPTHRIFLEPEGLNTDEWYINGISTSLPLEVQIEAVQSIRGLENAVLLRPAYAVEYDFSPPTQLYPSLESKKIENLFFAGQINGTSGYEEAACQGLVAGVNAVNKLRKQDPFVLKRHEAYIGVLIDDLVTKGTQEPYRMFTSRAEYRLLLNHHSAELRLYNHAKTYGLHTEDRANRIESKITSIKNWITRLETEKTTGGTWGTHLRAQSGKICPEGINLPEAFFALNKGTQEEVLYQIAYKGYLEREQRFLEKMDHLEDIILPETLDSFSINGLRKESQEKLAKIRPRTLGQAGRISGVSPADISLLMVHLKKR